VATFVFLLLHILKNEDSRMKVRGLVGFSSMAVGAALWVVELHTCRDYLKLHACWHLGVGAATYYVVRATHFARHKGGESEGFTGGGSPPDNPRAKKPASAAEGHAFVERACFSRREEREPSLCEPASAAEDTPSLSEPASAAEAHAFFALALLAR
jgi:hypothetical protein